VIHTGLNRKFDDMDVIFISNYFLVGDDISITSKTILVTDFVNLKIKPAQSFQDTRRGKIYVHIFIEVSTRTYISIYSVYKKTEKQPSNL
jgi:aspartate carbamoyltransferase catalytic subunit